MAAEENPPSGSEKKIVVRENGPYIVYGGIPLLKKTQVVSEYGEPLTWKNEGQIPVEGDVYKLCRCGKSAQMPFCDKTHKTIEFDGTETADPGPTEGRQRPLKKGVHLFIKKDPSLCMTSGFCGFYKAPLSTFIAESGDTQKRSLAMAMVERCPAGSLTYSIEPGEADIEPDLPQAIADTTEITSEGAIMGSLWVMGGIPVERADGQPFETRNRVTLCNCGKSTNKPLCDGTHRHRARELGRQRKKVT
jgi:CDGSH-type Zn-finger protein